MNTNWSSWTSVALGFWLIISALMPAFGPGWPARGEDLALGIAVMGLSSWPALAGSASRLWSIGLCLAAVWIVYAPLGLGYDVSRAALVNDVIVGIALFAVNAIVVAYRRSAASAS
ncbi:MAG TPA: hypothetical protein VNE16_05580 [Vicinamibacterales bacterium]|nr:hypothetical protein [Vicinamibacterales bacterium]